MSKLERLEQEVQELSLGELADFRKWFIAHDAAIWDQQFERDVEAGKLKALRDEAIAEHVSQRTKEL